MSQRMDQISEQRAFLDLEEEVIERVLVCSGYFPLPPQYPLLQSIVKWVSADIPNRKRSLNKLLVNIDFQSQDFYPWTFASFKSKVSAKLPPELASIFINESNYPILILRAIAHRMDPQNCKKLKCDTVPL